MPIHNVTFEQAIDLIHSRLDQPGLGMPFLVIPVNAQLVVLARK